MEVKHHTVEVNCGIDRVFWVNCSFNLPLILTGFPFTQFRYKTRVYKQTNLDEKQLAKLHTKVGTTAKVDHSS